MNIKYCYEIKCDCFIIIIIIIIIITIIYFYFFVSVNSKLGEHYMSSKVLNPIQAGGGGF